MGLVRAFLLASLFAAGLTGCGAALSQQLFPSFKCDNVGSTIDLGDAKGRYYAHWVDGGRVAVLRAEPYGGGGDDMRHVADVWLVDVRKRSAFKADKAWTATLMADLQQAKWGMRVFEESLANKAFKAAGEALAIVALFAGVRGGRSSDDKTAFDGALFQPDGRLVTYQGEFGSGSLRLVTEFGDSGTLYMGQSIGGLQSAMLGVQISPDGRYIKSASTIAEPSSGRHAEMFSDSCAGMTGVVVDPSWRYAAMLLEQDGRHRLALTPFSPESAW